MSLLMVRPSRIGACLFFLASAFVVPAVAEQSSDSFAHGGGFHHAGEWDGGFGPGFVGAFVDVGTGIEKPYLYGGSYGYHDHAPYGYDYGDCRIYKKPVKDGNRRHVIQFRECH